MSDTTRWNAVDEYLERAVIGDDSALVEALAANAAAGLPAIDVSPLQGKLLYMLAASAGARSILEIGTLGGYSTIWLARAVGKAGRVITLELSPKHADVARANLARAGVGDRVDIRVGAALDSLSRMVTDGQAPFDFIFIDADKPNIPGYFEFALKLSRVGSMIICDNVVREGAVADADSVDPNVIGVQQFLAAASVERRVSTTVIQTVGRKGYDGLAVSLVIAE
jgi:predicted O-methyltransferase YrrM